MNKVIFILLLLACVLITFSCEEEEGEGGTSSITGKVFVKNYNSDFTIKLGEYYASGIDVYIIYGNDSIYSDKFETGINGLYRFDYLRKGTYTLYALSADSTRLSPSGTVIIKETVEISDNHSNILVKDLVIFE